MTDEQMLTHDTLTVKMIENSRRILLVAGELKQSGIPSEQAIAVAAASAQLISEESKQ